MKLAIQGTVWKTPTSRNIYFKHRKGSWVGTDKSVGEICHFKKKRTFLKIFSDVRPKAPNVKDFGQIGPNMTKISRPGRHE